MTAAFAAPLRTATGAEHRVGVSVGVTLCDERTTPDAALAAADAAMYEVKAARRGRTSLPPTARRLAWDPAGRPAAVEPHEPAHGHR